MTKQEMESQLASYLDERYNLLKNITKRNGSTKEWIVSSAAYYHGVRRTISQIGISERSKDGTHQVAIKLDLDDVAVVQNAQNKLTALINKRCRMGKAVTNAGRTDVIRIACCSYFNGVYKTTSIIGKCKWEGEWKYCVELK